MIDWWKRWIDLFAHPLAANVSTTGAPETTSSVASPFADLIAEKSEPGLMTHGGAPVLRRFNWNRDADAVVAFQEDTFTLNFPDFIMTRRFESCFRNDLKRAANDWNHGIFVIEVHARVVGFLWVAVCGNAWTGERFGYINNVYVRADYRDRKLGRMLMEKAESFFRSKRVRKVRLTVTCSNALAMGLYRSLGYQTTRYEMEKELDE